MECVVWIWAVVTGITCLVWLSRHAQISRASRRLPPLSTAYPCRAEAELPTISFLVAAKEEEQNIEACLRSMLDQDYPGLHVLAINDRSNDRTGEIMDRLVRQSDRLTAIHVKELPAGWFGKNNAMREGVAAAAGQWLCFTDADCVQVSPRSLRTAMSYAIDRGADFLSVLPAHDTASFWERVIQPACSGIMMIWFNPLKVNDPSRSTAYANGAFMLMSRACYDRIGRHEAVRTEFNEDMKMARLAKQAGLKLRVVSNDDLYRLRMYQSFEQTWKGWSRIFFGCFGTWPRLVLTSALVVLFTLLPWAASAAAFWMRADSDTNGPTGVFLLLALSCCLVQTTVMFRFYHLNKTPWWFGLLYPIGAAVGLGALITAMVRLRKRSTITWRGTAYSTATGAPAP